MAYAIESSCAGCGMCISICPVKAVSGQPGRRHYIDGDYCIDCGACARVCKNAAVTDPMGNIQARSSKRTWPVPHFDREICRRCGKCYEMCPAGLITKPGADRLPALSNPKLCASCRWCEKVCVFHSIKFYPAGESENGAVL